MKNHKSYYWPIYALCILLATLSMQCSKKQPTTSGDAGNSPVITPPTQTTSPFVHPGILNTQASLDYIRTQASVTSSSRYSDFNATVVDFINKHAIPTSYPAVVVAKSSGSTTTETQIKSNATLVYAIALRWAESGDVTYANQAIGMLNGWSYNFQKYTIDTGSNASQYDLEAAWVAPTFCAAAEIMRYYTINGHGSGWSTADINQFSTFLNTLKNNYINNTPSYSNNWNVSAAYAKMAVGVFLNSTSVYQSGLDALKAIMPSVIQPDGTMPELCVRLDCVHFQYSLTGLTYGAEIARIQGDNSIYSFDSNRISAGYDYMRKAYSDQFASCAICSTEPMYGGVEIANRFYNTANTQSLRGLKPPIASPSDNTFLGFTTYTHFGVPL
jgi:hypothetical protein